VLAPRFESVRLWVHETGSGARMRVTRENEFYLPGLQLPEVVEVSDDLRCVLAARDSCWA
jgi:glycerol-3-phosphate dehydrogenase